jgi:hypothetical protein
VSGSDGVPKEFNPFWIPEGFQAKKARRPRKNVPPWASNDRAMRIRILGPALRRLRIAYLYWRLGWNSREVAEEMGMTTSQVQNTLHYLSNDGEA